MGDVVELFNKVTPEMAKNTIIDNLKNMHFGKWVNDMCAIRGLSDFSLAYDVLGVLISEKRVEVKRIPITNSLGRTIYASLYRYDALQEYIG